MNEGLFWTLAGGGMLLGSLHTLAPDHWVPFAAVARVRRGSAQRTVRVTALCGFGHVTTSSLLGLAGLVLGREALLRLGARLELIAGWLLIAFGVAYAVWGLRQRAGRRFHGHPHSHYDHVHDASSATAWTLFALFSADPCVAVIPLLFAAAPLGAVPTAAVIVLYELATIATMVALVLPARAGGQVLRAAWLDRHGEVVAGGLIACVGALVMFFGW